MRLPVPLFPATFLRRPNRFAIAASLGGAEVAAHLPNSGRLRELLVPGQTVFLAPAGRRATTETALPWSAPAPANRSLRRTHYDAVLVKMRDTFVSCDARLPPLLVAEAWAQRRLPLLASYTALLREPPLGHGRADLLFSGPTGALVVETKSITLVEGGIGLFPDAPTTRGTRHLQALGEVARSGGKAALVFVVQREDAEAVAPNDATDPAFGHALREAAKAGVTLLAYRCHVNRQAIRLAASLPVRL